MSETNSYREVCLSANGTSVVHKAGIGLKIAIIVNNSDVSPAVPRDLSVVLSAAFVLTDPDGVVVTIAAVFADFAAFLGTGVDGGLMFVTQDENELGKSGIWKLQAKVIAADGVTFYNDEIRFHVKESVEPDITYLPDTVLAPFRITWWDDLHTIGNPSRLGSWLDSWVLGPAAVSVGAAGGPARTLDDPLFGGKTSWLFDGNRRLEAGLVSDFVDLHNGLGSTMWGDFIPTDASAQTILWTAWNTSLVGIHLIYDGVNESLRWIVYNGDATALFDVITPAGSAPLNTRIRFAIQYKASFGPDFAIYINNVLVASGETEFGRNPSAALHSNVLTVGASVGGFVALDAKVAEFGFQRGAMAREIAHYLNNQP